MKPYKNYQKQKHIVLGFLCFWISISSFAQSEISSEDIVDPKSEVKEIFTGGVGRVLEGPAMSPDRNLYFTDIIVTHREGMKAGIIWKYDPQSGKTTVFRSPSGMANGLVFDTEGNLIVCEGADFGGRRVTKTDMKSGKSIILTALFNDKPYNAPNDVVLDANGRIYFTDPRYFGREPVEQPVNGVYRIDPDGSVHLIIANASKPNGIALSPDNQTLYIANAGNNNLGSLPAGFKGPVSETKCEILEYSLLPDGNAQFRGILIDLKDDCPDGLKIDIEGNLYIALGGKIGVYSWKGKKITDIEISNSGVINLCFGRDKFNKTLFITSRKKLYSLEIKKEGYHVPFKK